jgi:LEA14-like dessication related protein
MKNKKDIFIAALAVAAYYAYTTKKAIGQLNYYIKGVGLSFDNFSPLLLLQIEVQNPSNAAFTINSFVGNLSSGGDNIGNVSSFAKVVVAPASQIIYPIVVRLNLVTIVSDLVNLITKKSGIPQEVELTGYVNASGIVSSINLKYKIAF